MNSTKPITVRVGGKEHHIHIRRLKYRQKTTLSGILLMGVPAPKQKIDDDGVPMFDGNGEKVMEDRIVPIKNIGEYRVALIHASLCNEAGRPFFTVDEIDDWDPADIDAVTSQIDAENSLKDTALEEARGNSEATADDASSSS